MMNRTTRSVTVVSPAAVMAIASGVASMRDKECRASSSSSSSGGGGDGDKDGSDSRQNGKRVINGNPPATNATSFLDLPPEVRLLVYRHLMPNQPVVGWYAYDGIRPQRSPLRDDGEVCQPAMLRVNRLIYRELLPEWYTAVSYVARMDESKLYIINSPSTTSPASHLGPEARPHPGLPFLRHLRVRAAFPFPSNHLDEVALRAAGEEAASVCAEPHQGSIDLVKLFTAPPAESRLEQLHLVIEERLSHFMFLKRRPIVMRKIMEAMLHPLRPWSGLRRLALTLKFGAELMPHIRFSDLDQRDRKEMEDVVGHVWTAVVRQMAGVDDHPNPSHRLVPLRPGTWNLAVTSSSPTFRPRDIGDDGDDPSETTWAFAILYHEDDLEGTDAKEESGR
ncbi:MAG: hypothetical protein M1823_004382 [Watsoniomyces obsoletus]|nr:MAG: hypothetical protein M1823_004382 [Watsoniomyces obsoletus]